MLALIALLATTPESIHFQVDGQDREALVFRPEHQTAHPPVIFGFHGHLGNARQASRSFKLQEAWPEAIVVYPQGLPTKTFYDPQGTGNGWTCTPTANNPDLKFVDALYIKLTHEYGADQRRVFAMGHSNGAQFMYTLWSKRGKEFTGFGSCEGAGAQTVSLFPKPFFITIGDEDALVPPALQHRSLDKVFQVNASAKTGTPYGEKGTFYKGKVPTILWAYHGGHAFPADCVPTMVKFFKTLP